MRYFSAILFILFSCSCIGQGNQDTLHARITTLIEKSNNTSITKDEKKELKSYIYSIQNKGFILEENSHDYKNALTEINKAIVLWMSIKDTLAEANLRKYRGWLLANLNEFQEAKSESWLAIALFGSKKHSMGIAVSQHDLSLVYNLEGNIDSALYYENNAKLYWNSVADTFRIVVSNNQLINVYCKLKAYDKAQNIQSDTELILKNTNFNWHPLINFYFVSFQLYDEINNNELAVSYKKQYAEKIEELRKQGINAKSIYDRK